MRKMPEMVAMVTDDLGRGNGALLVLLLLYGWYYSAILRLLQWPLCHKIPIIFPFSLPYIFSAATWPGNEIRQIWEVPNVFSELYFRIPSTAVSQFTIHKGGLLPLPIDNIEIPLTSQRGGLCRA